MKKQRISIGEVALIMFAIPLLGGLMGGVYSVPAIYLTKERDPWLTLFLAIGLAVTVFGIGYTQQSPLQPLCWVFSISLLLLLLARWAFGSLGHSLERFGMVHIATLLLLGGMFSYQSIRTKVRNRELHQPPAPVSLRPTTL
jgi:hypothetical protein